MENVAIDRKFWNKRKVFLTGHTGFKGSWLSLWLQMLGADVTGYSFAPNTNPSMYLSADVDLGMISNIGDIRDQRSLEKAINGDNPEIIFHLAAQPIVRRSYADPIETFSTNVMGTANLLEICRKQSNLLAAVIITSDKCYENTGLEMGYEESSRLGGADPYSCSKACAELIVNSYKESFFKKTDFSENTAKIATARAGNVLGGGDWAEDRIIPDIVRHLFEKKSLEIRFPKAIRPWQHVLEPIMGYIMLAQQIALNKSGNLDGSYNFGPKPKESEETVEGIIKRFSIESGEQINWTHSGEDYPSEANQLKLLSDKAKDNLGWRPKLDLQATVQYTVEWYQAFYRKDDMREISLKQIERYYSAE